MHAYTSYVPNGDYCYHEWGVQRTNVEEVIGDILRGQDRTNEYAVLLATIRWPSLVLRSSRKAFAQHFHGVCCSI